MGEWISKFNTTEEFVNVETSLTTPHVSLTKDNMKVHFASHDFSNDHLTFIITAAGNIKWSGSTSNNSLKYSKDEGHTWTSVNSGNTISVSVGDRIMWKGISMIPQANKGLGRFSGDTNVRFNVEGNIMSILYDDFKWVSKIGNGGFHFYQLFYNNTGIVSAKNLILPATTLTEQCYSNMFCNCKSLTSAPELPSTRLETGCYAAMFMGCTSLAKAPELPATTLAIQCYSAMFQGCTSLTTAPELPATTLANYCYQYMFSGCTSLNNITCLATGVSGTNYTINWVNNVAATGTFIKNSSTTTWTTGINGIPSGWNVENRSVRKKRLRLWMDDFVFQPDYTVDDFISDPENCTSNGFRNLSYSIEIDGKEYYLFENIDSTASLTVKYALLTTNDYDTLMSQTITSDSMSTFPAFAGYLDQNEEDVYIPVSPKQLIKYDDDDILWIDDLWNGYQLIDWYNGNVYSPSDMYDYTGEMFELDGDEYYLWEMQNIPGGDTTVKYLLTDTIDYQTLYNQSLKESVTNVPSSIICFLNEDKEETYSGNNDSLIIRVQDLDA